MKRLNAQQKAQILQPIANKILLLKNGKVYINIC